MCIRVFVNLGGTFLCAATTSAGAVSCAFSALGAPACGRAFFVSVCAVVWSLGAFVSSVRK